VEQNSSRIGIDRSLKHRSLRHIYAKRSRREGRHHAWLEGRARVDNVECEVL
jgi:hypothetical protein